MDAFEKAKTAKKVDAIAASTPSSSEGTIARASYRAKYVIMF